MTLSHHSGSGEAWSAHRDDRIARPAIRTSKSTAVIWVQIGGRREPRNTGRWFEPNPGMNVIADCPVLAKVPKPGMAGLYCPLVCGVQIVAGL